jgi:hypothetical protein
MHIKEKIKAVKKIASLLSDNGLVVLSIDKNQSEFIEVGTRKIKIYPDNTSDMCKYINEAKMTPIKQFETDLAYIIVSKNNCINK